MNYLVKGWHKYNFFLSPNKLEKILAEYHLVIFNAHVPVDYTESALEEYLSVYDRLSDLLFSGKKIDRNSDDYPLFLHLHRGITSDLSNCVYGGPHLYEEKQYQFADFNEPVVGIGPISLWVSVGEDQKPHCSTSYSYAFYPEYYMGVQLQYPKMIQYRKDDGYESLKTTKDLSSYQDFERLKKSIKEVSHILTIRTTDGIEKRTDIRVDDEVKSRLNRCWSFRQNGLSVK
ncbi:MAG: hypothetical protein NC337_00110 [Roseburia sp.]|nr:hypothetical protein [Roseburia sp.]